MDPFRDCQSEDWLRGAYAPSERTNLWAFALRMLADWRHRRRKASA